tara:strand:- start:662 stop:1864 length:1203 start_codon:yes stop_codon:yes gene_type:complete
MDKVAPLSIIIPSQNFSYSLEKVLESIKKQSLVPKEIVVVDSSRSEENKGIVKKFEKFLNIKFIKVAHAYPGEARNLGVKNCTENTLLFIDSKTVLSEGYLSEIFSLFNKSNYKVIFGKTVYLADSVKQKIIKAATFGSLGHETTPGTIINKDTFIEVGGFLEGVRTAEDLEWRARVKSKRLRHLCPDQPFLTYSEIPNSYKEMLSRYFKYSFHTARVNVQENIKGLYLSLALILSALIIPRWNYIVGWDNENLYIPNVTKIYLFSLIVIFISTTYFNRALISKYFTDPVSFYLKLLIFIFISLGVYNWNFSIAGWIEEASLYIPHITKIYLSSIIFLSILYRGIYLPIKLKEDRQFLFPLRWIQISIIGLGLDLAKIPGYVAGGLIQPFLISRKKANLD